MIWIVRLLLVVGAVGGILLFGTAVADSMASRGIDRTRQMRMSCFGVLACIILFAASFFVQVF